MDTVGSTIGFSISVVSTAHIFHTTLAVPAADHRNERIPTFPASQQPRVTVLGLIAVCRAGLLFEQALHLLPFLFSYDHRLSRPKLLQAVSKPHQSRSSAAAAISRETNAGILTCGRCGLGSLILCREKEFSFGFPACSVIFSRCRTLFSRSSSCVRVGQNGQLIEATSNALEFAGVFPQSVYYHNLVPQGGGADISQGLCLTASPALCLP